MDTPKQKDWVDDTNLNTLNWRNTTLKRIAKEYDLKPGECVIFENAKKEKARLVININGMPCLIMLPVDPKRQLSMHLEVNMFLRELAGTVKAKKAIDDRRKDIEERLAARKKRKENARRRRAKTKK